MFLDEMNNIRQEKKDLEEKLKAMEDKYKKIRMSAEMVRDNDVQYKYYTGLTWNVFVTLFEYTSARAPTPRRNQKVSLMDQLFLVLTKLRLDVHFQYLVNQAGCSKAGLNDFFWHWIV